MITVSSFEMARPIVQPMNLPDSAAQQAKDCYAQTTGLDPLRSGKWLANGFTGCKTLYRLGNQFVALERDVSIVPSPIIQDSYKRLYFTLNDTGGFYSSTENLFPAQEINGRKLSDLKPPSTAPTTQLLVDGVPKEVTDEDKEKATSFRVTFVTDQGEESAPSPASDIQWYVDRTNYGIWFKTLPISTYPYVTKKRIYMALEGDYFLIKEVDAALIEYKLDPFVDSDISDQLSTDNYDPVPEGLYGLVGLPNGVMSAFINNGETSTIFFSEPYQPHAWPVRYRHKSLWNVIALAAVPEGLLVLNKGIPQLIVGSTPDVMMSHDIENGQSCLSAKSVVVVAGVCYWASPDGVAAFGAGRTEVISLNTWTREQWQAMQPSSMLFGFYENHLLIYSTAGAWMFSLARRDVCQLSEAGVTEILMDLRNDKTYIVRGDSVYAFGEGASLLSYWHSKDYLLVQARSFSAGRIEADQYPVQLVCLTEQGEYFAKSVQNNQVFRLRSSGRKRRFSFTLQSSGRVRAVQLAVSARELG